MNSKLQQNLSNKTRFAQMNIDQLKEKARDNNLRRCILRCLILESDFARRNSKFEQLVTEYRHVAPVFQRTVPQRQLRHFHVRVGDNNVRIIVNLCDSFSQTIWERAQPFLVFNETTQKGRRLEAQGLFGIDLKVTHGMDTDGPLLNLIQSLTSVASSVLDFANDSARIVSLASFIYRFIRMLFAKEFDKFEAVLLMLEGCARLTDTARLFEMANTLKGHLYIVYQWINNKLVAQIAELDSISSLATIFCVLFGTSILKRVPKGSEIDECVTGAAKFGNLMKGISGAWTVIEKVAQWTFAKVYEWMYGVPPHVVELEKCVQGITQWYLDVQTLVSLHTPDEIAMDSEKCVQIETLYSQGVRYSAMVSDFKFDRNIMAGFQTHFRVLQACYDRAQSSGAFRGGPRIEPIVIHIHGQSGVGKSGMMFPLAIDLLKIDGIPNGDFTQQIYNRNIEQEFWDGYRGQRVCIYDDFGQMRDSQASPNLEFMELIRTGNLAPYPLHMATLEDKAKTYFKSRVVLLTSNTAVFRPESLSWPDAVRRRVDMSVEIRVKQRFAKFDQEAHVWRLDQSLVLEQLGVPQSMEVYNVYECDPQTGLHLTRRPMSYEEFRAKADRLYRLRFERSSQLFAFLQERANEPLEAQLHVPTLHEGAEYKLRDCELAMQQFSFSDFALWCEFGFEEAGLLFDCEARMWMNQDRVAMGRRSISPAQAYDNFLKRAATVKYHADAQKFVHSQMVLKDYMSDLGFSNAQRFPFLCHFLEDQAPVLSTRVQTIQRVLKESLVGVKDTFDKILSKARETLAKASWYHCAIAAVPVVAVVWYFFAKREPSSVWRRKFAARDVVTELSASADPKTMNVKKLHVEQNECELSSSADPKTMKAKKLQVETIGCELSASGDPKTLNARKLQVEGDSTDISELETEVADTWMKRTATALGAAFGYASFKVSRPLSAQLQMDPNAYAISKKVLNNIYELELQIAGRWSARMKICMIRGRIGLTVAHLAPYLNQASHVRLFNANVPSGHVFPIEKVFWHIVEDKLGQAKDQMLVCFPPALHDHPDIVGSIADSPTMSSFKKTTAVLCLPYEGGAMLKSGEIAAFDQDYVQYNDGEKIYTIRDRYEYKTLETTRGDCGGILVGIGEHLNKKILGIHVAGNRGLGVSSPLAVKDVLRTMAKFSVEAQICLNVDEYLKMPGVNGEVTLPEGNFVPVGQSLYTIPSATKSQLRPSVCHGKIVEATTAPSVLQRVVRDGKIVDPMYNGLKKAGIIPPDLNDTYLDAAINDMTRVICSNILPSDCRILSNLEAVTGIEGDDCLPPVKRSSSAGYPWVATKTGMGKTKWLGCDDYFLSPDVELVMRLRENMAREGKRYPTFWIDTLKDERRPLEKIEAVKTRVFSAGPMDYTLSFRKYFLGFAAHCMRNRIGNEISVGTNVYSFDWTKTVKKCTSKGKKVIAGDFSNFDGTLLLPILYRILDIVNEFYNDGEENALVRHVMWKEIINSIHLCGDNVYMWTHSQPSGCPITAILNSIFNSVSMRYCWMVVFKNDPIMQSMRMFNKHVAMVSYGDDNVINISDEICERFNQLTIAQAYATIGMIYTDEAKSGEMVKYRDIESVAYLKRKFVWNPEEMMWVAPLAMETVLEMTNWIRGDLDQELSTSVNLETSAFELSLHGKETFDFWIKKYIHASRDFVDRPCFLTYDEYRKSEAVKYGRLNEALNE
jgi:hypothetical protein